MSDRTNCNWPDCGNPSGVGGECMCPDKAPPPALRTAPAAPTEGTLPTQERMRYLVAALRTLNGTTRQMDELVAGIETLFLAALSRSAPAVPRFATTPEEARRCQKCGALIEHKDGGVFIAIGHDCRPAAPPAVSEEDVTRAVKTLTGPYFDGPLVTDYAARVREALTDFASRHAAAPTDPQAIADSDAAYENASEFAVHSGVQDHDDASETPKDVTRAATHHSDSETRALATHGTPRGTNSTSLGGASASTEGHEGSAAAAPASGGRDWTREILLLRRLATHDIAKRAGHTMADSQMLDALADYLAAAELRSRSAAPAAPTMNTWPNFQDFPWGECSVQLVPFGERHTFPSRADAEKFVAGAAPTQGKP